MGVALPDGVGTLSEPHDSNATTKNKIFEKTILRPQWHDHFPHLVKKLQSCNMSGVDSTWMAVPINQVSRPRIEAHINAGPYISRGLNMVLELPKSPQFCPQRR